MIFRGYGTLGPEPFGARAFQGFRIVSFNLSSRIGPTSRLYLSLRLRSFLHDPRHIAIDSPVSQNSPSYPGAQLQVKPPIVFVHPPLLLQGLGTVAHSSRSGMIQQRRGVRLRKVHGQPFRNNNMFTPEPPLLPAYHVIKFHIS